ncbi:hypothetical protein BCR34DRAFT_385267 [Clohesyomyces aquaticus]|uniref:C2H2-type domain-containing protein n=1 Tax=Clohesyomyces aquaticus TaxID=1231657 RepID=A0A1Y1ZFJ7_9PLEO|nr:hypothetical protein BCR34DRAFT_385267 [Clohesyomyces aquaticus]
MSGPESFDLKHDTASVYSMDSGFQSQTGTSRQGNTLPEGFQSISPQDTRSRVSSQFIGSNDLYSPTLSSDNYTPFSEHQSNMPQMQLASAAGEPGMGDNMSMYQNYSTGQDFTPYSTLSMPGFTPVGGMNLSSTWSFADEQNFSAPFNFSSYHNSGDMMFNNPTPAMRNVRPPQPEVDTNVRPTSVRSSSSYLGDQRDVRRSTVADTNSTTFLISPNSPAAVSVPAPINEDFEQHHVDARNEKDDTASISLGQSVFDEDGSLSPSDAAEAKNMEDEQGQLARSHELYTAKPDEHGKYHCPKEGEAGCNHGPTSLKCNYDKYVDSHLKPFRCKNKACLGVQFSSTACLLRHEREAHGMHGHGSRPHLCQYPDCDRSLPGHGFPRRYNLFDHMKRVHDWSPPATEPSPPVGQGTNATGRKNASRKRKSTADDGSEKRPKVVKLTLQQQLQQKRKQLQQDFLDKKQIIIDILTNLNGPSELDDSQLTKEVMRLNDLSDEYKKSLGG